MISKLVYVFLCLLFAISVQAKIVTVETIGRGSTLGEALMDGANRAVEQVNGFSITSDQLYMTVYKYEESQKNKKTQDELNLYTNLEKRIKNNTNGFIDGYEIITRDVDADGLYTVKMRVDVKRYDTPGYGDNNRYGIAVRGVAAEPGICYDGYISSDALKNDMERLLLSAFVDTRKFSVLDRKEYEIYDDEENFIKSDKVDVSERLKLGKAKGTDYLLTAKIKDFRIQGEDIYIRLTGEHVKVVKASAIIDYQISIFSTRQVKVANTIRVTLNNQEIEDKSCSGISNLLFSKAAHVIVDRCMENIYPHRVLKVSGKNIYITYGAGNVQTGDVFDVFETSEELIVPHTAETLGSEEVKIGTLQITEVKPKYSIGNLISGDLLKVKHLDILRKVKE